MDRNTNLKYVCILVHYFGQYSYSTNIFCDFVTVYRYYTRTRTLYQNYIFTFNIILKEINDIIKYR